MSVLVTPDEMRAAEAAAVAAGRPESELMRVAAAGIADRIDRYIRRRASARRLAVALVGPGNNGGDALVGLANLVERGWQCAAINLGRASFGELPAADELLSQIDAVGLDQLDAADVIIDGVYGVRGRATLSDEVASAFRRAYDVRVEHGTPLITIDVPSGVDAATGAAAPDAFQADVTLCLGLPKIGLVREPAASHAGELELLDIGIAPPDGDDRPCLIDERTVRRLLPRRRASAHKHGTGTVLVIGGAPTYYGAPRLCGDAAARSGAGLVCVATPAAIVPVIAAQVPELVFLPLDESPATAARQIVGWIEGRDGRLDSVVVGPGLGQSRFAAELQERLLGDAYGISLFSSVRASNTIATVLDADSLNWIAKRGDWPQGLPAGWSVMTPHAGEMGRLLGMSAADIARDPHAAIRLASQRFDQTVILKSGYSAVASTSEPTSVAPRATPELATAGTGDVLAGLIGGLLAQRLQPYDAARVALFVGSRAGKLAREEHGIHGVVARDLIKRIPEVLKRLAEPEWTDDGIA